MELADEYPKIRIRHGSSIYQCLEHAQWAVFLNHLDLTFDYQPVRHEIEWVGTERYKVGSKTRRVHFEPTFFLEDYGYLHVTAIRPLAETLQCAERLANHSDETVFVTQGPPAPPYRGREAVNEIYVCHGGCAAKQSYRMLHNGRQFSFGRPRILQDVFAPRIIDAALLARQLRYKSYVAKESPIDGDTFEGN